MEGQRSHPPPFSIRLLKREDDDGADAYPPNDDLPPWLLPLLPAPYRTESSDVAAASRHVTACIETELDLQRLHRVLAWLLVVGRPMPPRPLHYQRLLSREIFVTERMDMHLVWTTGRIFLKPVPRFLLEPRFWTEHLSCTRDCHGSEDDVDPRGNMQEYNCRCGRRRFRRCALGFLFSYAALIAHESDFPIAADCHLLPPEVRWPDWRIFVDQLDTEHIYPRVDARFLYGELRLSRLNKIYRLSRRSFLRGYASHWHQYGTFFRDNLAWLASATVYAVVVLAAMQVGLATRSLAENDSFQSASSGFSVFSIVGPLVAAGLILIAFCYMFVNNWIVAVIYNKRRFRGMRVRAPSGS